MFLEIFFTSPHWNIRWCWTSSYWSVARLASGRTNPGHLPVTPAALWKRFKWNGKQKAKGRHRSLEKRLLRSCFPITTWRSRIPCENSPRPTPKLFFLFVTVFLGSRCQIQTPQKKKIKNQQKPVAQLQTCALIGQMTAPEFNYFLLLWIVVSDL